MSLILVIEDNPITRKMLRVALQSEGYHVIEAADGQTALQLAGQQSPDLVLQDLLLSDIDGFELVARLRALPELDDVPILAISGLLSRMEQAQSLPGGFNDFLFKPIAPTHLLSAVDAYLRPPRACGERPGAGRRVLVADDDPMQLKLLRIQLEHRGFVVETATDGEQALASARRDPPAAIVSDVLMPYMDGFRLCLALRREPALAQVPILLISAVYTEASDRQLAHSVGANAFILRTSDNDELMQALAACLDGRYPPMTTASAELPLEDYTHRVIRQLEHQVSLSGALARRLALLEAELGILGRIVETLNSNAPLDTVLDELLYRCLDAAGISCGATYLLGPDGVLTLRAQLGYPSTEEPALAHFFGHADLLYRVMERGEPVEVSLMGPAVKGMSEILAQAGARSILLAPLTLGKECLGIIEMASSSRELGPDWLAFARGISSQISQAIELARTFSRLSISEQRYRDLVHGLDAIVWEADVASEQFTFVSHQAETIFSFPRERWLEEPGLLYGHAELADRVGLEAAVRQALDGRTPAVEYRVRTGNDQVIWLRNTFHLLSEGEDPRRGLRGIMVDVTGDRQRRKQEVQLQLAREIQQHLFPDAPLQWQSFDIAAASFPAEETGGDYCDHVLLPDGALALAIGDVTGHGFGSALLMAEVRAYFRALALAHSDVCTIAGLLNRRLAADLSGDNFVTLLLASLHPSSHRLRYTSAGHVTGFVLSSSGKVKATLPSTALPLGIDPHTVFPAGVEVCLEPGDLALLLTDGVIEECAPDKSPFGIDRALSVAHHYRHHSALEIVHNLYHAVRAFCQGCAQSDDITALVVKERTTS